MQFLKSLWYQWRFAIPIALIVVGIVLNFHAVTKWIQKGTSIPSSNPMLTINQQQKSNSSSLPSISTPSIESTPITSLGEPKFGHFPYPEGDSENMMIVASYAQNEYQRFERLAPEAALALMKLIYAARDEGVWIVPVSGFRNIAAQDNLFKKQIEKRGSPEAAAKLSAPPGFSEHHTGYAVDLTDGHFPKKDITYEFVKTDAFQWLNRHAREFGFEMSFTEGNSQGVSYEPWHWRFVGSSDAAKVFARARQLGHS